MATMKRQIKIGKAPPGTKIVLVVSEYNREITKKLEGSALQELKKAGVSSRGISTFYAPGAFELPYMCQRVIQSASGGKPDGIIALGCVIKGETPHFNFIASACSNGIMDVSLKNHIPISFGVLTPNNLAQARDRVQGGKRGDKGVEATLTLLKLLQSWKRSQ